MRCLPHLGLHFGIRQEHASSVLPADQTEQMQSNSRESQVSSYAQTSCSPTYSTFHSNHIFFTMPLMSSGNAHMPSPESLHQRRLRRTSASWITSAEPLDAYLGPFDGHCENSREISLPSIIIDDSAKRAIERDRTRLQQRRNRELAGASGTSGRTNLGSKRRGPTRTSEHTTIIHKLDDRSSFAEPV